MSPSSLFSAPCSRPCKWQVFQKYFLKKCVTGQSNLLSYSGEIVFYVLIYPFDLFICLFQNLSGFPGGQSHGLEDARENLPLSHNPSLPN